MSVIIILSFIARWHSLDPKADKYPGRPPYNYCLNNPINLFDPDGREIKSVKTVNADGTTSYHMTYTATLVNNSGQMILPDKMHQIERSITRQIEKSFTGSSDDGTVKWSIEVDINVGEVRPNDNIISIENLPHAGQSLYFDKNSGNRCCYHQFRRYERSWKNRRT